MPTAYENFNRAKANLYEIIEGIYTGYEASMPAYVGFGKTSSMDIVQAWSVNKNVVNNTAYDIYFTGNVYSIYKDGSGVCKKLIIKPGGTLPFVLTAKTMQSDDDYRDTIPNISRPTLKNYLTEAIEEVSGLQVSF